MPRPVFQIANDIERNWKNVSPYARPYLDAMHDLISIEQMYYADSGDMVVRYFLSNANGWRGEDARRIKAELKGMLK